MYKKQSIINVAYCDTVNTLLEREREREIERERETQRERERDSERLREKERDSERKREGGERHTYIIEDNEIII